MNNSKKPLRVGLAGCGAISEMYYAPALVELEKAGGFQVAALMDPSPERAGLFKADFPGAAVVHDLAGLANARPDLAIVASPPRFHAEQTIHLLGEGISVLCEKPMATSVAEAEQMVEAAAKSSARVLAIGLFRRFFPALQAMRSIITNEGLGPIRHFHIAEGAIFAWPAQSASFFQKASSKGGVLLDVGVHVLDIVQWWFGEPTHISYEDDAMGGLEANCRIELGYGGFTGEVQLSRDTALANRYLVQCENGWLAWRPLESNRFEMQFTGSPSKLETSVRRGADFYGCFSNQLRNMRDAILGDAKVFIPPEEGLKSLRLIERCYRERKFMEMPWLSARESEQAAALAAAAGRPS